MTGLPCAAGVLLLAPLAALAAAFFLTHPRRPDLTHWPILASCAAVTGAAWWLAWQVWQGASWDETLWHWLSAGPFAVDFGVRVDGLGAAVLAMVTLVGSLIHVYAVGYMKDDPGFSRFFLYFHLFFFSMIGLLLSNNYLQLYLFWEGVGLASYLLIGFWYERESARRAALKAFLTNRVGDACFLLAVFLLLAATGTVRFTELFLRLGRMEPGLLSAVAALLFLGATAKSAQFPLYIWLPDAMEGPTPTSALMHAATMVTAGVFLMMRSWPLLEKAPGVLPVIAWTGGLTALGAAVVASMKRDLKRILAYSTVSHLGLMMLAVGMGNIYAAAAHLVIHGFFKATLFLCAGNVLHGLGKPTATVDDVGGLRGAMPLTYWSCLVACLSLAAIPPFAGFFSKDLIFGAVWAGGSWPLTAVMTAVAVGSAFYIFRFLWITFAGHRPDQTGAHAHPHPNGPWMDVPVALLAAGSFGAGMLFELTGVLHRLVMTGPLWVGEPFPEPRLDLGLAAAGSAAAFLGLGLACWLTLLKPSWDWTWRRLHPELEAWLDGDFGWQGAVRDWAAAPAAALAEFTAWTWDVRTWDRFVESIADSCLGLSEGLSGLSRGLLNDYLWWMAAGTALLVLALAI